MDLNKKVKLKLLIEGFEEKGKNNLWATGQI